MVSPFFPLSPQNPYVIKQETPSISISSSSTIIAHFLCKRTTDQEILIDNIVLTIKQVIFNIHHHYNFDASYIEYIKTVIDLFLEEVEEEVHDCHCIIDLHNLQEVNFHFQNEQQPNSMPHWLSSTSTSTTNTKPGRECILPRNLLWCYTSIFIWTESYHSDIEDLRAQKLYPCMQTSNKWISQFLDLGHVEPKYPIGNHHAIHEVRDEN